MSIKLLGGYMVHKKWFVFIVSGLVLTLLSQTGMLAAAQKKPFPMGLDFSGPDCNGKMRTIYKPAVTQAKLNQDVWDYYLKWKNGVTVPTPLNGHLVGPFNFQMQVGGVWMTKEGYLIHHTVGGGSTKKISSSEAMGYGLNIVVLMAHDDAVAPELGDPDAHKIFDGLYRVAKACYSPKSNALMSWIVPEKITLNTTAYVAELDGNATDGDMNIAYALILAHNQWGSAGEINYLDEAKTRIKAIEQYNMINEAGVLWDDPNCPWDTNLWWLTCGDAYKVSPDKYYFRPSDIQRSHMRLFWELNAATPSSYTNWNNLWRDSINVMIAAMDAHSSAAGLVPDFLYFDRVQMKYASVATEADVFKYFDEVPGLPDEGVIKNCYSWNACRVPLWLALDYAHNKSLRSPMRLTTILDWLVTIPPLKDGTIDINDIDPSWNLDGTPLKDVEYDNMAFVGPFITACIIDPKYKTYLDSGWAYMWTQFYGWDATQEEYYSDTMNLLSMLLISGNWWPPTDLGDRPGIAWKAYKNYRAGNIVLYKNNIWQCRQGHYSIYGWEPGAPGVYLWLNRSDNDSWAPNKEFKTGDQVIYKDQLYRCLQYHVTLPGWEPDRTPALWARVY
jgi:endo-1,4-beta-D-glucanase Y